VCVKPPSCKKETKTAPSEKCSTPIAPSKSCTSKKSKCQTSWSRLETSNWSETPILLYGTAACAPLLWFSKPHLPATSLAFWHTQANWSYPCCDGSVDTRHLLLLVLENQSSVTTPNVKFIPKKLSKCTTLHDSCMFCALRESNRIDTNKT
jgi:hypothetical protein